jgi:hypothetical protein
MAGLLGRFFLFWRCYQEGSTEMGLLRFIRHFNVLAVCFGFVLILSGLPVLISQPALTGLSSNTALWRALSAVGHCAAGVSIVYLVAAFIYGVRAIATRFGSRKLSPVMRSSFSK